MGRKSVYIRNYGVPKLVKFFTKPIIIIDIIVVTRKSEQWEQATIKAIEETIENRMQQKKGQSDNFVTD